MRRIAVLVTLLLSSIAAERAIAQNSSDIEKSADPGSKVICKRFLETGSLVKGYRICKTKTEWTRDRDAARQQTATGSCRASGEGGSCN